LEQIFGDYQVNFEHPLSAESFEALSHSMRNRSEEASRSMLTNGDEALVLRAFGQGPFLRNGLMDTELKVRKRDWQIVEQRLQVKTVDGTTNYTLERVAFEVIALNLVPPSIFAESTVPATVLRPVTPPTAIPAEEEQPTEGDLIAAEVEAWFSLHSMGACLGRPMRVVRIGQSRVEVQGVVENEETKAQILAALRRIPHVTCSIRTVAQEKVDDSTQIADHEPVATVEPGISLAFETLPRMLGAEQLLEQFFAKGDCASLSAEAKGTCIQQKIAKLSREVLITSEAALAQAWALRQLGEWYSSTRQCGLRISGRRLVELMVRDHLTALHQECGRSRTLIGPVLRSFLGNYSTSSGEIEPVPSVTQHAGRAADWVPATGRLCSAVEQTTDLVLGMFVNSNRPVAGAEAAARGLLATLAGLDATLTELEGDAALELSGASKAVATGKPGGNEPMPRQPY